jgi:transcriptional regulator with XRE-family HTH domain
MQPASTIFQPAGGYYATDRPLRIWQHARMRHFLKEWRELRGLTQEQVAEAVGLAHKASINKIESKPEKDLSTRRVKALASILQITSEDLYRKPHPIHDLSIAVSQTVLVDNESPDTGGQKMVNELRAWMQEASDLPEDLIPAARSMLRTLKAVGEQRHSNPQTRVKGK